MALRPDLDIVLEDRLRRELTPETLADVWNEVMPAPISRVRLPLSPLRRQLLLQRLHDHPQAEVWVEGLRRIARSRFCRGENDRGWVVSFSNQICQRRDFILKAAEGCYDDRPLNLTREESVAYRRWRRDLALSGRDGCSHEPACQDREQHEDELRRDWVRRVRWGRR